MEQYSRAYRDPRSPLTPLTPLTTKSFNFETSSLKSPFTHTPKHFSKKFRELRDIYENKIERGREPSLSSKEFTPVPVPRVEVQSCYGCVSSPKMTNKRNNKHEDTIKNKHFKCASPVAPRMLSPRVRSLLHKINLDHLSGLFCRQEIDSDVLSMMSLEDLKSVGIKKPSDLHQLTNAIKYAKAMFR